MNLRAMQVLLLSVILFSPYQFFGNLRRYNSLILNLYIHIEIKGIRYG
jgi:hypothetical protein